MREMRECRAIYTGVSARDAAARGCGLGRNGWLGLQRTVAAMAFCVKRQQRPGKEEGRLRDCQRRRRGDK